MDFLVELFYGRFLSCRTPTMAIAMIMAIVATTMQVIKSVVVAMFDAATAAGPDVAGASLAQKDVSAEDGQYEFEPAKLAITV